MTRGLMQKLERGDHLTDKQLQTLTTFFNEMYRNLEMFGTDYRPMGVEMLKQSLNLQSFQKARIV